MEKPNFEGFIDPSLPTGFKYDEAKRAEMRANGLTDEEIDQKEAMANLKKLDEKMEEEMMSQGIKQDEGGVMEAISPEEAEEIIRQFDQRNKDQAA
jgi:hypothetical protein